jgi:NAD(P)-dependent dehydrogenase (short-subunit alcohol dehydrogenase family)
MPERVVLVTGTSSGFGRLLAEACAARDMVVYATMRDVARHAEVAAQLTALGPNVRVAELDVTSDRDAEKVVKQVEREAGRLDVLVNNAGTLYGGVTEALTVDQFAAQFETNVIGLFRVTRAMLPLMRRQRSGLIVNISSIAGRLAFPFFGAYCASKWAVDGLTESMRYELSTLGIDVVAVEPGFFHTNLFLRGTRSSDTGRANDYGEAAAIPERLFAAFDQLFESQPVETDPRILVNAIGALLDAAPGTRPLRTCVGMDVGVRQLNGLTASFGPNAIAAFGMAHLEDVGKARAAGATV